MTITPRQELVLAAMSAGNSSPDLSPVQAQKLFFLVDKNIAGLIDGPHFSFKPYDYGPFDSAVYAELDSLDALYGYVQIERAGSYRTYRLTGPGQARGRDALSRMAPSTADYLGRLKDWVKSLGFRDLVSAIYRDYPDMRVNSIFQG